MNPKLNFRGPSSIDATSLDTVQLENVQGNAYQSQTGKTSAIAKSAPAVQRKSSETDDETVMRKEKSSRQSQVSANFQSTINATKGGGSKIERRAQDELSSKFGEDFSAVKIHNNSRAHQLASEINAKAFTVGQEIYFNNGEYQPNSKAGKKLLAHELTHTVQQKSNTVVQKVQRTVDCEELKQTLDGGDEYVEMCESGVDCCSTDALTAGEVGYCEYMKEQGWVNHECDLTRFQYDVDRERYGAVGPQASGSLKSKYKTRAEENPQAVFTGSGSSGISPSESYISWWDMWFLSGQIKKAKAEFGKEWQKLIQTETAGYELIFQYSNPMKFIQPAEYFASLSEEERLERVLVLFGRDINTEFEEMYTDKLPSRIQVIRAAAAQYRLEPELVAAIIMAEQIDQSKKEDATDFQGANWGKSISVGLGQINVSSANKYDLLDNVQNSQDQTDINNGNTSVIGKYLASDEFNIFGIAKYIRHVADMGAKISGEVFGSYTFMQTGFGAGSLSKADLAVLSEHSGNWGREVYIVLIGSEYTSKPFDMIHYKGWGELVLHSYHDIKLSGVFQTM
ncbi:MAG: hypothetical protein ACI8ZM_002281 [Crocinitomix sp.]|jgi:hypothetical protein